MLLTDPLSTDFEKKATRDGYGKGLVAAGKDNSKIVVLDADLSGSTRTNWFSKEFPERFFNFGVAEQNLVGQAAGMALSGLIPVASSFAIFVTGRAWEIVRNSVAYPALNVKLAASHAGITLGEDGASHQIIEDIAVMRTIPGMTVLVPADYWQAYNAIYAAIDFQGPVYIRLGRPGIPMMYGENDKFEIGKAHIMQEGKDVAFFCTGVMVYEAWKAAALIEKETGKKPWVVNFSTIKPLDKDTLLKVARQVKKVYTFEEHNIMGGFGSAVSEVLVEEHPVAMQRIGIEDKFGQSGTVSALMNEYGLSAEKLAERLSAQINEL